MLRFIFLCLCSIGLHYSSLLTAVVMVPEQSVIVQNAQISVGTDRAFVVIEDQGEQTLLQVRPEDFFTFLNLWQNANFTVIITGEGNYKIVGEGQEFILQKPFSEERWSLMFGGWNGYTIEDVEESTVMLNPTDPSANHKLESWTSSHESSFQTIQSWQPGDQVINVSVSAFSSSGKVQFVGNLLFRFNTREEAQDWLWTTFPKVEGVWVYS
jgi:hypothetical protein